MKTPRDDDEMAAGSRDIRLITLLMAKRKQMEASALKRRTRKTVKLSLEFMARYRPLD